MDMQRMEEVIISNDSFLSDKLNPALPSLISLVRVSTGKVDDVSFESIKKKIQNFTGYESIYSFVINNSKKATIGSRSTKEVFVDFKKRSCDRVTFGSEIVELLKEDVDNLLDEYLKSNTEIEDVKLLMSHCDIMLYRGSREDNKIGDHFDFHRDTDSGMATDGFVDSTLIICLDSNIDKSFPNFEGNTDLFSLPKYIKYEEYIHSIPDSTEYHSYAESTIPQKFIIFPIGLIHRGHEVLEEGAYKLVMKFDIIVKPKLSDISFSIQKIKSKCSCQSCSVPCYNFNYNYDENFDDDYCNGYEDSYY